VTSPQPGVNLTMRQVNTTSLSSDLDLYTRNLVVPPVPGLARSRPGPGGQDYLSQLRDWSAGYAAVAAARGAARRAATAGAATIACLLCLASEGCRSGGPGGCGYAGSSRIRVQVRTSHAWKRSGLQLRCCPPPDAVPSLYGDLTHLAAAAMGRSIYCVNPYVDSRSA